jgi:hypothetical protein
LNAIRRCLAGANLILAQNGVSGGSCLTSNRASRLAAQKKIGTEIQFQALQKVPYYPLGMAQNATAFRKDITGVREGFVIFWNVRRT